MFHIGSSLWFGGSCAELVDVQLQVDGRVTFGVLFTEGVRQQRRVLSPEEVLQVARAAQAVNTEGRMVPAHVVFDLSPATWEDAGFGVSAYGETSCAEEHGREYL